MREQDDHERTDPSTRQESDDHFDANANEGGSMGGGASGPRGMPTGGRGPESARSGRDDDGAEEAIAGSRPGEEEGRFERDREEIESYGSRDDDSDGPLSPSSQIGRARQTGGTPESRRAPGVEAREGWPMPEQDDTPDTWPDPSND